MFSFSVVLQSSSQVLILSAISKYLCLSVLEFTSTSLHVRGKCPTFYSAAFICNPSSCL